VRLKPTSESPEYDGTEPPIKSGAAFVRNHITNDHRDQREKSWTRFVAHESLCELYNVVILAPRDEPVDLPRPILYQDKIRAIRRPIRNRRSTAEEWPGFGFVCGSLPGDPQYKRFQFARRAKICFDAGFCHRVHRGHRETLLMPAGFFVSAFSGISVAKNEIWFRPPVGL
jgi:hypothetical protein